MTKFKTLIKNKIAVISGVIAGLIVGAGASMMVYAAIPGTNGTISSCYDNSTGALKVIDTGASEECGAGETALNWNQGAPTAYAHINYDSNASDWVLDTVRSKNVTLSSTTGQVFCLTVSFAPKSVSATGGGNIVGIKDANGWTSSEAESCDSDAPGSNVAFLPGSGSFFVTLTQ
jgi:hypothetical protein